MANQLQTQRQKASVPVAQQLRELHGTISKHKDKIFGGVPAHVNRDRLVASAMLAVRDNPELAQCSHASFCNSLAKAGHYGWEIGGVMAHAYLIPFRDGKKETIEAVLVPGYRGLMDLCNRSGEIESWSPPRVVHEGDQFQFAYGDDERILHTPSSDEKRESRPITYAYVIVRLKNGGVVRDVWTAARLNAHKEQYSKGWKRPDSLWQTRWDVAAWKTIIRSLIMRGLIPMSAEIVEAFQKEDEQVVDASSWTVELDEVFNEDAPQPEQQPDDQPDEGEAVMRVRLAIDKCDTLKDVNETKAAALEGLSQEGRFDVEQYAEARSEVIRSSRGEGSNKK